MADVRIVRVDERDSNWEFHDPRFRVYLHGSGESSTHGWTDTYDITGIDVLEVIDWAQKQAENSLTYAVALVWDDKAQEELEPGRGRGLIWLVGKDGNTGVIDEREADALRRMLARRAEAVHIPAPIGCRQASRTHTTTARSRADMAPHKPQTAESSRGAMDYWDGTAGWRGFQSSAPPIPPIVAAPP